MDSLDADTRRDSTQGPEHAHAPLALTLLVHPDERRLGEQAPWPPEVAVLELGRTAPDFDRAPLTSRRVSRSPLRLVRQGPQVLLSDSTGAATCAGRPVGEATVLSALQLREGVVLTLSRHVWLLLREGLSASAAVPGVAGPSPELERARRVLAQPLRPVLFTGPAGVGKSYLAGAGAGAGSPRRLLASAPGLDAGTLTRALAQPGTVILEDVDQLPVALQVVLGRVLEASGASGPSIRASLRLTALEPRGLVPALLASVAHVPLPPLSRRREDLAAQIAAFLASAAVPSPGWLTTEQQATLHARPWEGQTRELHAVLQELVDVYGASERSRLAEVLPPREADAAFLVQAREIIDARLDDDALSVQALARALAMSPRTLQRRLQDVCGQSPQDFLRQHRLQRARELLQSGRYTTVSEVAHAVGMSRSAFSRAYREWFGRSPSEDAAR